MTGFRPNANVDRNADRLWLWGAAAVLLAAAITIVAHDRRRVSTPSAESRNIRLRLAGFSWNPYRADRPGSLQSLVRSSEGSSRSAVARLLVGRAREALETLSTVSEDSTDPRIWNDLAVAYYETSERHDAPALLVDALAATDRALALDREMAEALFNRASVLQRLGLRDDARVAWERFLACDGESGWAIEAREQLRRVQPEPSFLESLDNGRVAHDLVRSDPQGARLTGTIDLLARWAHAVRRGDSALAERQLARAREIGTLLAAQNGDATLVEAVRAIDVAGGTTRAELAAAQLLYVEGVTASRTNRPGEAESALLRAAEAFARAGSSLAFAARENAARMMYEEGRDGDARREHDRLLRELPATMPALRAHSRWQFGVIEASAGRWGEALRNLESSVAGFRQLGESEHASRVERVIAFVYDRTGDSARAWKHRMVALRGIGKTTSLALEKTVATMALAKMYERQWRVAEALLDLEGEIATRTGDDVQKVDALLYRACVRHELGDGAGAVRDATDAESITARLADPSYRAYFEADAFVLRARLESNPNRAVALFSEAIDYLGVKGDAMDLPRLLLQRARAHRRNGDRNRAMADLLRGMDKLEVSRSSLPDGEARWGAFHAHEELYEEAIDIAVEDGDAAAALRFTERTRARSLLDAFGREPSFDSLQLPHDHTVVEIVALPTRIVLITAAREGLRMVTTEGDRPTLRAEVDSFVQALQKDDARAARVAGSKLYRRLIEPIAEDLAGAGTVVFIPDGVTAILPFSALSDEQGRYLIESHPVVVAPSAAVYAAALRHRRTTSPGSVLIVSSGTRVGDPLPHVTSESRAVRSVYRQAREIHDAAELRENGVADVIHFAGHAVGDESGLEPASLLLQENGRERRMSVAEIARLRLPSTSVVVLAGCGTARGERRGTEGVISVAYGFLTAGAPSVIATLWPIEDKAAAAFFPRIHERLAAGDTPAEALRNTQLDAIRRGDTPLSLWSSVQNIGS